MQLLQRVIRGVQQLRGECATRQVEGAEVAMCTNGGAGALFTDVMLLGKERTVTLLGPQTGDIPRAVPERRSAAVLGRLRARRAAVPALQRLRPDHPHARACCARTARRANLDWERSAGTGAVYSWTTVWRPQTPAFTVPYLPVIVDVDEGWQMLSNLVGCEHDAVDDRACGSRSSSTRSTTRSRCPYWHPS